MNEQPKLHELKTQRKYFCDVSCGEKNFEVRNNDRNFKKGDLVILREWEDGIYLGHEIFLQITYVLDDPAYCKDGFVVFGFDSTVFKSTRERMSEYLLERGITR
jgi:hypothetical protein